MASTARTLNLNAVWKRHGGDAAWKSSPFFRNVMLNRCIIVKHRLRSNEIDLFADGRLSATKVIFPINDLELKFGARYLFVGQRGYGDLLQEISVGQQGQNPADTRDRQLLDVLDALPSLDPFLTREVMTRKGFKPAQLYFDITEADMTRMFAFLRAELQPLIGLSFDDLDVRSDDRTAKLATKILANSADEDLEPFRVGMGMSRSDFEEGVFCWKGFVYYKWVLSELLPQIRPVIDEIGAIKPTGKSSLDDRAYISKTRDALSGSVRRSCATVIETLKVYEDAYADLTRNGKPDAFREFLKTAPSLFYELGERLGGVQHIVTFWRYRFPGRKALKVSTDELVDILMDFEGTLARPKADLH